MKLFLVGFMGSGKSTLGKVVAQQLNCSFVDLDEYIEQNENQSIGNLFETIGEQGFRHLEQHYLGVLCAMQQDLLVATGGGAPCFFDNMAAMLRAGKVIYLKANPLTLAGRLENEKHKRPLIATLSNDALLAFISEKLAARSTYYEQSNHTIAVDDLTLAEQVSQIQAQIN